MLAKNFEFADPIGGIFQPPWFELLDIDKTFPLVELGVTINSKLNDWLLLLIPASAGVLI